MVVATVAYAGDPASETNWADRTHPKGNSKIHDKIAASHRAIRVGELELALQDYDVTILLDPNDAMAYANRGIAYDELGEYQLAIHDFDKAIQLNPNYIKAYFKRGDSYMGLGEWELAIQDFGDVIQLDPNDVSAYYWRGWLYGLIDQNVKADADKAKACSLDSKYC